MNSVGAETHTFSLGVVGRQLLSQPTGLEYLRGGVRGKVVEIGNKENGLLGGPTSRPLRQRAWCHPTRGNEEGGMLVPFH